MVELILSNKLRQSVSALVKGEQPRLAVAFWGEGAAEQLGILAVAKKCRIICNLSTGGTNPKEIRKLIAAGATIKQMDKLHAKVYLANGRAIVGSSNASANGLSFQGDDLKGWVEANLFAQEDALTRQLDDWFEKLWKEEARPIKEKDLLTAELSWSRRRQAARAITSPVGKLNLLKTLKKNPEVLSDRRIFITFYHGESPDDCWDRLEEVKKRYRKEGYTTDNLSFLQVWEYPKESHLVCFRAGPRGGLAFEGVWYVPEFPAVIIPSDGDRMTIMQKSDLKFEIDLKAWKPIATTVRDSKLQEKYGMRPMELGEFARRFLR